MNAHVVLTVVALFLIGAFMIALAHVRTGADRSNFKEDWLKYGIYLGIVSALISLVWWSLEVVPFVVCVLLVGGVIELYGNFRTHMGKPVLVTAVGSTLIAIGLIHLVVAPRAQWQTGFALVFLLTCLTDAFSQLWGKLIGSIKLCPTISPGKTLEGLILGLITVAVTAPFLHDLWPEASVVALVTVGLTVGCAATAGDLAFSLLKRRLGVKDFSAAIPGHGGILDRFDSLVFSAPTFYWMQRWFGN